MSYSIISYNLRSWISGNIIQHHRSHIILNISYHRRQTWLVSGSHGWGIVFVRTTRAVCPSPKLMNSWHRPSLGCSSNGRKWESHRKTLGKWWFHGILWDISSGNDWHSYGKWTKWTIYRCFTYSNSDFP